MRLSFVTENTVDVASDVNQSLLEADGLIVSRVTGIETAPPAVLIDGLRVAIASGATGAFAGKAGQLGVYVESGAFWQFYSPALCVFDGVTYLSAGGDWIQSSGGEEFTLAEKQKLSGIADEATKNRADSENADKVHTHTVAQVTGLGTAATRDAVTSNTDTTAERLMRVGSGGIFGNSDPSQITPAQIEGAAPNGVYRIHSSTTSPEKPFVSGSMFSFSYTPSVANLQTQLAISNLTNGMAFRGTQGGRSWSYVHHTGNTTVDPDGTLKASSPVINLYTDKHDLHSEGQFGATPTVVRKSKGVYEITGTLGLRSDGWYLDTPSDRNGNKYFNIEWTQNITPDAVDGVVDEYRDDIVVTIETFERVWNKDTGLFENGAPIDINELQDRFVQLRFNEIKVEHEELGDDTN